MAVGFPDQVVAFLAKPTNLGQFLTTVGLPAFASTSLIQKYGQDAFKIDAVTLGTPADLQFQESLFGDVRITGSREKRSEQPERYAYDLRVRREDSGWADAVFTIPVQFTLHMMPGSIKLGPTGDVLPAGVSEPSLLKHQLKFVLPVGTDSFTLSYTSTVYVFVAADPSLVADLRRVLGLRRLLEADPQFLASLDGTPDQQPYLFVQVYPSGILQGGPLSETAVVQTFAVTDVLAAFISSPSL
jgi:hypothetical protein